jgi:hypothetical protein
LNSASNSSAASTFATHLCRKRQKLSEKSGSVSVLDATVAGVPLEFRRGRKSHGSAEGPPTSVYGHRLVGANVGNQAAHRVAVERVAVPATEMPCAVFKDARRPRTVFGP